MRILCLMVLALVASSVPARVHANMALDRVVLQFRAGEAMRQDVEVLNTGEDLLYLVVEPREVLGAGSDGEQRVERHNPEELGLLVSPNRAVIEPGARRLVRISLLATPAASERVWRVSFRPVAGETEADGNAIRILTAYNVLVVAYPEAPEVAIVAERDGQNLLLENQGNSNALLFDGEQCDSRGENCRALPSRRLYAGNRWELDLPYNTPATWRQQTIKGVEDLSF